MEVQMEVKITDFFTVETAAEAAIRSCIIPAPSPKRKPRRVGRPRKHPRQCIEPAVASQQPAAVASQQPAAVASQQPSTSDGATGEPSGKLIHKRYAYAQKIKIADYARLHGLRPAERKFGVHRRNIDRWKKIRIDQFKKNHLKKAFNKKGQGRKISYPQDTEDLLVQWVLEMRDVQLAVSSEMLKQQAKVLITPIVPTFKASNGWCQKFMRRHSLVFRQKTSLAQRLPKNLEEQIAAYGFSIKELRERTDVPKTCLGNMDETPVYFDMVPGKTIHMKGAKTIKIRTTGSEKRHLTVVLTCTAHGGFLPPIIIFKGKTNRTIKKLVVPTGFVVATQDKAWMDDHLMLRYIDDIWMPYIKTTGCTESILCLDKFQAHISASTDSKLKANNVHPSVIPGGCISVLQPLDVCLNKPFKSLLRHSWQNYMLKCSEKNKLDPNEKIPPPSRQDRQRGPP